MKNNTEYTAENGYLVFSSLKDGEVNVSFSASLESECEIIEGKEYVAFTYGPLLLALDNTADVSIDEISINKDSELIKNGKIFISEVNAGDKKLQAVFRDYATAGRQNNNEYMVWIPVK